MAKPVKSTDDYFFDTDCISAFLWVNHQNILAKLYPGRIIISQQVYDELCYVPELKYKVANMLANDDVKLMDIDYGTPEYDDFEEMTQHPPNEFKIIGNGEASAIALVRAHGGVIASNNTRDIYYYVEKYNLNTVSTGDILVEAYKRNLITEEEGNQIWKNMINHHRWLPTKTFTEYLERKNPIHSE